jgi:hypothetical protein
MNQCMNQNESINVSMYYESVKYLEDCNFFVVVKLEVLFGFG